MRISDWSSDVCSSDLNGIARSREEAIAVANRIGYPVLICPSYVLGGRAMEIVDGESQLNDYIATAVKVSGDSPVLIDRYLRDAVEVDVDALCDGTDVVVRSEEHTSELQSLMRISYAVFCLKKKNTKEIYQH